MLYKGYKIKVRCLEWEQINTLGEYWHFITSTILSEKLVGLGMNWTDDGQYFDYAIGTINDENTLNEMKKIDFSQTSFKVEYVEINLPDYNWQTFKGKEKNLKQIYEQEIDCYNKPYNYELEYIDGRGNLEIKIHFI